MKMANTLHKQHGFTLVEVMVAITIGLVMTAGILQVSQANKESSRLQRNMGYIQQNIRSAMELLGRDIKMAGHYIDDNPAARILTSPAPFTNVSAVTSLIDAVPITADGGGSDNDQITLIYEVTGSTPADCLGTVPAVIAAGEPLAGNSFIVNHYFIRNQRLMCEGNGNPGSPQPLVDNVESLQILYGESTGGDPRVANVYVQAQEITVINNVVSVRIGMRFISRETVRPTAGAVSYALLDAAATPYNDRFLRREITTTISLRNSNL